MTILWRVKHSIDVVAAAIEHRINRVQPIQGDLYFVLDVRNVNEVVRIYRINYFEGSWHANGDDLAAIKLRKINEELTEVLISEGYLPESDKDRQDIYSYLKSITFKYDAEDTVFEKMLSERQNLKEKILVELKKGFEEDGLFGEILHPSQTSGNITINIKGNVNDGNIIIGDNNDVNTK